MPNRPLITCSTPPAFFGDSFPAGAAVAGATPPRAGAGAFPRAVTKGEATGLIGGRGEAVSPRERTSAAGPMGPKSYSRLAATCIRSHPSSDDMDVRRDGMRRSRGPAIVRIVGLL